MTNLARSLVLGCSVLALAACGPEDIASPGTGGNITINNPPAPAPAPSPSPSATPAPTGVTPAAGCPTVATDSGTITGPTGTWRVCSLPNMIPASLTLTKVPGVLYRLSGRTDVGCDGGFAPPTAGAPYTTTTVGCPLGTPAGRLTADTAVNLTIEPGVIIYADTGQSWLAVNRGNRITANGSATAPIVFTSRDNVLGLNTNASQGQWGGIVLMGRAVTTDCTGGGVSATVGSPGTANTCERATEGATSPALFGGNNNADNSGRLSFVQIRYSGFVLSQGIELQSLTGEGVGSGTILNNIQSVNSSDDGSEWFGGNFGVKYMIAVGADDDSLDVDTGAQANFQHVILAQRPGRGDALMEIDSSGVSEDSLPRTKLTVANFTAVAQNQTSTDNENNDQASTLFRGNSDTTLVNGLIVAPANECIRINGTSVNGSAAATLTARSVALTCGSNKYIGNGTYNATSVGTAFGSGSNNNNDALASTLTNLFVNGANESALVATDPRPLFAGTSALANFLDSTTWVGAVRASDTWYQGWTCNTDLANFGTGNSGACTSLPVT